MRESVRALYARNRQRGHAAWCGYDYDFVCPSMGTYPFQWFWDSCFHTVALAHFDRERARSEIRSLLKNAQPDGFVAHVTFWQREAFEEMLKTYSIAYRTPYLSDCIQPPVRAGASAMRARAARTTEGLVSKCYDAEAGLFFDLAGRREERLRVNTVSSLLPLALPDLPAKVAERVVGHITDEREYAAPFPVPSVAMNEPSYAPGVVGIKLVWRGPTWMNTNWYLARGLRRHGRPDLARHIEDRSGALVERDGFREYYQPATGVGDWATDRSWTALVVDLLAASAEE